MERVELDMCHSLFLCLMLMFPVQVATVAQNQWSPPVVTAPGDIIIGGIFSIHHLVEKLSHPAPPTPPVCSKVSPKGLSKTLAMIHAVDVMNRSPLLTSRGITLGFRIHDSCSDVSTALWAADSFIQSIIDCSPWRNYSHCSQPTFPVIGAQSSELSIAVARELTLELIPQISYSSTASTLSDKDRYPAFMRTVPSDKYQTKAMVKLLSDSGWNWIGILISEGDYGYSALNEIVPMALEAGICVAFKLIFPDPLKQPNQTFEHAINTIITNTKVKVIVSFANPSHMKLLFRYLRGKITSDRLWIASDIWSTSEHVLDGEKLSNVGQVVGFTFQSGSTSSYQHFLRSLQNDTQLWRNSSILRELFSSLDPHSAPENDSTAIDMMLRNIHSDGIFSVQMAVSAIAQAVANLCLDNTCTIPGSVQPWQLLRELRNITFRHEGEMYRFDKDGDINLSYSVLLWKTRNEAVTSNNVVAGYNVHNNSFTYPSTQAQSTVMQLQTVVSKCSDSCEPGQFKKTAVGQHICCYECINCTENHFTNRTDMAECYSCNHSKEWAEEGSSECRPKILEFFTWMDGFAVVLLCGAVVGIVLALLVAILFLLYRQSPVVKAAGGPLCQIILLSLTGSFVSAMFFVGQPTDIQCKVRQVLFGLSFTLCVSCILVKSLKILLAFQMNLELQELVRKLYRPGIIICVCMSLQGLTCALWLGLKSPRRKHMVFPRYLLAECDEGSNAALGVMLGYIAVLALVCFGFAFKGRKLPEKYNEAKFITFGMLIYLISWVIFVPVYVTTNGKYLPAVEMVVILISNYGILCCHFLPKCYIILFKKEHNTKDAFLKNVYEYSNKNTDGIGISVGTKAEHIPENNISVFDSPVFIPDEKAEESAPKCDGTTKTCQPPQTLKSPETEL